MSESNLKNVVIFANKDGGNESRTPHATHDHIDITLAGGFNLLVETMNLGADVLHQATLHGLKQKLVDSVAGKSGREASDALTATYEMLSAGNWTRPREAGSSSNTTLLIEALMRVFKKSREACIAVIEQQDDNGKALSNHDTIKPVILEIRAERAAQKATDALDAVDATDDGFNPFA